MRIVRPILIGVLGGLFAVAAWSGSTHLLSWRPGRIAISEVERWVLIGCGFAYGLLGGAFLARRLSYLPAWAVAAGIYTALVCEVMHQLSRNGVDGSGAAAVAFCAGFLFSAPVSLVPQSDCNEDALRFAVTGALIRLLPCVVVSIALLGLASVLRNLDAMFVGVLGCFGVALLWTSIWQELRIRKLDLAVRQLQRDSASSAKAAPFD